MGEVDINESFLVPHSEEKVLTHEVDNEVLMELMCKESFPQASRLDMLETHVMTHAGERAFQCEFCGKSFLREKNLKRHMVMV